MFTNIKNFKRVSMITLLAGSLVVAQSGFQGEILADNTLSTVKLTCDAAPKILTEQDKLYVLDCGSLTLKTDSDGKTAGIHIPNSGSYHLKIEGTVTAIGNNAKRFNGAVPGVYVNEGATLNLYGSGMLNATGGNAANGENGNAALGISDYGIGGGGAAAGIGGYGGNGGEDSGIDGKNGGDAGALIVHDSLILNAIGGAGGIGGNGGKGGPSAFLTAAVLTYGYAGDGGGGGGGGGFPAAGIGGGGAGGGAGGSSTSGERKGISIFIGSVVERCHGGSGGGGGAGYGPGGGGGPGTDAIILQFPAPVIIHLSWNEGGNGSSAGSDAKNAQDRFITGSLYPGRLSGGGGKGGTADFKPGAGGSVEQYSSGQSGGKTGKPGKSGYTFYYNEDSSYNVNRQLSNGVTGNSEDFGTGGGNTSGFKSSVVKMYDLSKAAISVTPQVRSYNGDSVVPKIIAKASDGSIIPSDSYEVIYDNDFVNIGKYEAKLKGKASLGTQRYVNGERIINYEIIQGEFVPNVSLSASKVNVKSEVVASILNNDSGGTVTWVVEEGSAPVTLSSTTGSNITITADAIGKVKVHAEVSETKNYKATRSVTKEFEITPEGVENFQISGLVDIPYTGSPIKQDGMVVRYKGNKLKEKEDYEVRYEDNIERGEATVTIIGKGSYQGEVSTCFYITKADITKATITKPNDLVYTGSDQTSKPVLKYAGKTLIEDVDYTLAYDEYLKGNVNVTVSGMKNFMGNTLTSYTIQSADINTLNDFEILSIPIATYTGLPQTPIVRVNFMGRTLTEGTDYTVLYNSNTMVGEAMVTVQGIGIFKGSMETSFTIEKKFLDIIPDSGQSKYAGESDKELTYKYVGNVALDIPSFVSGTSLSRMQGEALGTYDIKLGSLELGDDEISKNYELRMGKFVTYEIKPFNTEANATLNGKIGDDNWYVERAQITAPSGYLISLSEDSKGTWSPYVTVNDGNYTDTGVPYYLKNKDNGLISQSKNIKFKQDTIGPDSRIEVNHAKSWTGMYEHPKFLTYFSAKKPVVVNAYGDDDLSKLNFIEYYVSKEILAVEDLEKLTDSEWKKGAEFTLNTDGHYIIYTKMKDKAGNINYGRSDGFIIDSKDPQVSYVYEKEGKWTSEENPIITVHVKDEDSGLKDRYVDYTIGDKVQLISLDASGNGTINHLPDGDYTLNLHAEDNSSNTLELPISIKKDTQVPQISVSGDILSYAPEQAIQVSPVVGPSGIKKVSMQYVEKSEDFDPNGSWQDISKDIEDKNQYVAKNNGTYYFKVESVVGLSSEITSIAFTRIDREKPVVDARATRSNKTSYESNDWSNSPVELEIRNSSKNLGDSKFEYQIDGSEWHSLINTDGVSTLETTTQGEHTYNLRITSAAGIKSDVLTYIVNIDKTLPAAEIEVMENKWTTFLSSITLNKFFKETVDVKINTKDENSGIDKVEIFVANADENSLYKQLPKTEEELEDYVQENGGWISGETLSLKANDRHNVIYARVYDIAGNVKYVSSEGFTLDTKAPEVLIEAKEESDFGSVGKWVTQKDAYLNIVMNDVLSGIQSASYKVDNGKVVDVETISSFQIHDLKEGSYDVSVYAKDMAGNEITQTKSINVDTKSVKVGLAQGDPDAYAAFQNVIVDPQVGASGILKVETQFVEEGNSFSHTKWKDVTSTYQTGEKIVKKGTFYARVMNNLGEMSSDAWTFDRISYTAPVIKSDIVNEQKEIVKDETWIDGKGGICFYNNPLNVMNFTYEYKVEDGSWVNVKPDKGHTAFVSANDLPQGTSKISLRVGNENVDGNIEYSQVTRTVHIDKSAPFAELIIGDRDAQDHLKFTDLTSTNLVEKNRIQHFYPKEKAVFLKDVSDAAASENSGLKSIDYYIAKSSIGEYINEFPDTKEEVESYVKNRWTTISASGWEDSLEKDIKSAMLKDLGLNRSYVIYAKVNDIAGNSTYISSQGFALDNTKPEIVTDYKESGWITDDSQTIKVSLHKSLGGMGGGYYEINNIHYDVSSDKIIDNMYFEIPMNTLIEGDNTLLLSAKNAIGVAADNVTLRIRKDSIKPTIEVSGDVKTYSLAQKISLNPITGDSLLYKVEMKKNDGIWEDITQTYTKGVIAEKNGTYSFRITNNARIISDITSIVFDRIESDPPVIDLDADEKDDETDGIHYEEGKWTNKDVEMNVRNMQNNYGISTYEYSLNNRVDWRLLGTSDSSDEQLTIKEDKPGIHNFNFRIRSQLGLVSNIKDISVKIDKESPIAIEAIEENDWSTISTIRVKAADDLSGFGIAAFSFDGGMSYQNTPVATFNENKEIDIVVRDQAGNITETKGVVSHVDSFAPGISSGKQDSEEWKKSKRVSAVVKDAIPTKESGMSGVSDVFLTSHNPYRGSTLVRTTPLEDDIIMRYSQGTDTYISERAITQYYGDEESDNFWIIAKDEAGNLAATSLCVNRIDGDKKTDPIPDDPKPEKPKPDNPSTGETPVEKPDKPNKGEGSNGGNGENGNPGIMDEIKDMEDTIENANKEDNKNNENVKNEITDILDEIENLLKDETLTAEEKQVILEKKTILIEHLVNLLCKENPSSKKDIKESLQAIKKLLARDDLTKGQRIELEKKQLSLEKKYKDLGGDFDQIVVVSIVIVCLIVTCGAVMYIRYYRKKFKEIKTVD